MDLNFQSWNTQTRRNGAQNRTELLDTASIDTGKPPGQHQFGSGRKEMPGHTYTLELSIFTNAIDLIEA